MLILPMTHSRSRSSINEVICHGIPDQRELQNGDIVNIDISTFYNGYHGDVNATYLVGEVDEESKKLVRVTRECLDLAIAMVKPGTFYRDVGAVIQRHANEHGLSVVRSYCGHGVGRLFHTAPSIPHYGRNKAVGIMKPGHIFSIEPMINMGTCVYSLTHSHARRREPSLTLLRLMPLRDRYMARPTVARRLDRRHQGRQALGTVRRDDAGHRHWRRGAHRRASCRVGWRPTHTPPVVW